MFYWGCCGEYHEADSLKDGGDKLLAHANEKHDGKHLSTSVSGWCADNFANSLVCPEGLRALLNSRTSG